MYQPNFAYSTSILGLVQIRFNEPNLFRREIKLSKIFTQFSINCTLDFLEVFFKLMYKPIPFSFSLWHSKKVEFLKNCWSII